MASTYSALCFAYMFKRLLCELQAETKQKSYLFSCNHCFRQRQVSLNQALIFLTLNIFSSVLFFGLMWLKSNCCLASCHKSKQQVSSLREMSTNISNGCGIKAGCLQSNVISEIEIFSFFCIKQKTHETENLSESTVKGLTPSVHK